MSVIECFYVLTVYYYDINYNKLQGNTITINNYRKATLARK